MFRDTITIFNYHAQTGLWYPSVVSCACVSENGGTNAAKNGVQNSDTAEILLQCNADKSVLTSIGQKNYLGAKAYANCDNPEKYFTFHAQQDFILVGGLQDISPISDADNDAGLYHKMNDTQDGVYMIHTAAFYGLLPHFEIGGR